MCYDPAVYNYRPGQREHSVGFIGGANPAREQMLLELTKRDLLSYAVGGPWRSSEIRRVCHSSNIPAAETAKLYQQTRIVVNVFRTAHHFNREHIPAFSMNPRIYEALACGAVVVCERRPEIEQICPELPVFDGPEEMVSTIERLLADPERFDAIRRACIRRLAGHTYAQRLFSAFTVAAGRPVKQPGVAPRVVAPEVSATWAATRVVEVVQPARVLPTLPGWEADRGSIDSHQDAIIMHARRPSAPGSETGLTGSQSYGDVRLSFEIETQPGAVFVAKIHQASPSDQTSNSYHLMVTGADVYVARHDHIFYSFALATGAWHAVDFSWHRGTLRLLVNGKVEHTARDSLLASGHCFVGVKVGTVRLRGLQVDVPSPVEAAEAGSVPVPMSAAMPVPGTLHDVIYDSGSQLDPQISIITTVYDRVACLDACIRSVQALTFDHYEHIIVADASPASVVPHIQALVESSFDGRHRLRLVQLRTRANDWGMTPAITGLSLATGSYVCFLSDDNGYKSTHFEKLCAALDADPGLGFVYSGCLYDGRATLNVAPPAFGRIDLGQPLLRRDLFEHHLPGRWPFRCLAWDWKMIDHLLQRRVRWKHIRDATFLFRLAKYPSLAPPLRRNMTQAAMPAAPVALSQSRSANENPRRPKRMEFQPFTAAPRRNLLYHVWPVRGSMWRWNIEQLKPRLALFNGRGSISIAHDDRY